MKVLSVEHLSYSSVSLYLMCARSWRYRYIDRVKTPVASALPFGSAFHEAIRLCVEAKALGNEPEPISDLFTRAWHWHVDNEDIDYGDKDSPESLQSLGHRMLSSRDAVRVLSGLMPKIEDDQPITEKRVEFCIDGVEVPIVGYIDMIGDDGVPVDFKTSSRLWYASRADSELQPSLYLEALRQLGQMPQGGEFRYYIFTKAKTPKVQIIDTSRSPEQLAWTRDVIRDVWSAIVAGAFPPSGIGGWKCSQKYCEYWDVCHKG